MLPSASVSAHRKLRAFGAVFYSLLQRAQSSGPGCSAKHVHEHPPPCVLLPRCGTRIARNCRKQQKRKGSSTHERPTSTSERAKHPRSPEQAASELAVLLREAAALNSVGCDPGTLGKPADEWYSMRFPDTEYQIRMHFVLKHGLPCTARLEAGEGAESSGAGPHPRLGAFVKHASRA